MRIPIDIAGKEWSLIFDEKIFGGHFKAAGKELLVGTALKEDILDIMLHEIVEATLHERGCRYTIYSVDTNERVMMVMTHHEFSNIITDLARSIKGMITLPKIKKDKKRHVVLDSGRKKT